MPVAGYNLYMNNLSANIANSQMSKISEKIKISSSNGNYYNNRLKNIENLKLYNYSKVSSSSFWVYTIFVHRPRDLILRLKKKVYKHHNYISEMTNIQYLKIVKIKKN